MSAAALEMSAEKREALRRAKEAWLAKDADLRDAANARKRAEITRSLLGMLAMFALCLGLGCLLYLWSGEHLGLVILGVAALLLTFGLVSWIFRTPGALAILVLLGLITR